MIRSYTMRLKATKRQQVALADLLEHLCVLYNQALAERTNAWRQEQRSVGYYDQQSGLTKFRQGSEEVAVFPVAIQRDPLRRVDRAFKSFFRRVKAKEKPGYPRFKGRSQYDSFTASEAFRVEGDTVYLPKLGGFRFKTKYKIKGEPKVVHVQRRGKHWIASIACDIGEAPEKVPVSSAVGIDLGLTTLATLSDGTEIKNPRWTRQEEDRLALANQSLARKKRGSKNRLKAKERLRRTHQRIAGLRRSYLHGVSRGLLNKYDLIAHENLKINNMVRSNFAKSIMDAAWGELLRQLRYKAESAGKYVIAVNPRNTSQNCSKCGTKVPKELAQRTHDCPNCSLILGRDLNAAMNILRLGESLVSKQNYVPEPERELCI